MIEELETRSVLHRSVPMLLLIIVNEEVKAVFAREWTLPSLSDLVDRLRDLSSWTFARGSRREPDVVPMDPLLSRTRSFVPRKGVGPQLSGVVEESLRYSQLLTLHVSDGVFASRHTLLSGC